MTSIRSIDRSTAAGSKGRRSQITSPEHSHVAETGRALVTVAPAVPPRRIQDDLGRPNAPFLAQLIANKQNLPQARERRRAEPQEAIAAYVAAGRVA